LHETAFNDSRVVPGERADRPDEPTDFRNSVKAPKIGLPPVDIQTANNITSGKYGVHITLWTG